jgi:hypothetical protein
MRARSFVLYCYVAIPVSSLARDLVANGPLSASALAEQIAAHLNQERFKSAHWGVKIETASVLNGT